MRASSISTLGLVLAIGSVVALGVSVTALARKLATRNIDMVRLIGRLTGSYEIAYEGDVCRVEVVDGEDGAPGKILVHWGTHTLEYPMWMRPNYDEGEFLKPYKDWFGVMILADGAEGEDQLQAQWKGPQGPRTRLVVAARYPAEGFDPGSWGLVRRKEWQYRLALLEPAGPTRSEPTVEQWDKTYEELDAIFLPGKYTKMRHPEWVPATEAERHDKLWMFYAMLEVTPPMHYRGRDKGSEAVIASMGWPWPVAAAGSMGVLIGIAMFVSGRVRRPNAA